jgi:CBS domain-containing protein
MELRRNLKTDPISRLSPTPPRLIEAVKPVSVAVQMMRDSNSGCLLVTRQEKLVGIFTERDLLVRVMATRLTLSVPIAEVMTSNPVTVKLDESVRTAINRMEEGSYRHLPVISEDGKPVGILSVKRIVRYVAEHYPNTVFALPDPNNIPDSPEGA